MNDVLGYPEPCVSCGLYRKSAYYKSQPEFIPNSGSGRSVVVITHMPDSSGGFANPQDGPNQFLKDACGVITNPVWLTSAVLCEPDFQLKGKELSNTYQQCNIWFNSLLAQLTNAGPDSEPGCVIACGLAAFKSLFPKTHLTLTQATKTIHYYKIGDWEIPVLVIFEPSNHMSFRDYHGRDLRPEYCDTFFFAKRLADKTYVKPVVNYEIIPMNSDADLYMAKEWFARSHYKLADAVCFDTEVSINPDDYFKRTNQHPNSKIIAYVLEYTNQFGQSQCAVFRTRGLSKRVIFDLIIGQLFHDPEGPPAIFGSNLQFDFTTLICHVGEETNLRIETAFWFFNALARFPKSMKDSIRDYTDAFEDSFLFNFCWDQGSLGNGLKGLYVKYTKEPDYSLEIDEYRKQHNIKDYIDLPPELLELYAARDGNAQGVVMRVELPKIDAQVNPNSHEGFQQMSYHFKKWEVISSIILSLQGLPFDNTYFQSQLIQQNQMIEYLEGFVNSSPLAWYTGRLDKNGQPRPELNVKSGPQMHCLIENIIKNLGLDESKFSRTETGLFQFQPNLHILQNIEGHIGDVFKALEKIRELRDLISKHISMPLDFGLPGPCRYHLHANFKIARSEFSQSTTNQKVSGTKTAEGVGHGGRYSSEPNVQNIPARINPEIVAIVRRGYRAVDDDHLLVNGDLKTIEPVVRAWMSGCQKAKDVFLLGCREPKNPYGDWYLAVGSPFLKKAPPDITKAERNLAKNNILLAINYGQHPRVLCDILNCSEQEAYQLYNDFFRIHFPEFHIMYAETRERVLMGLPIHNLAGGTKIFKLSKTYNYKREEHFWMLPYELEKELGLTGNDAHEIRAADNFTVQGKAAWINNAGMVNLTRLQMIHPKFRAIKQHLTIHDALLFSVPKKDHQYWVNVIATILYSPVLLGQVGYQLFHPDQNPLRGEFKIGETYYDGDMKEIDYSILPEILELFFQ